MTRTCARLRQIHAPVCRREETPEGGLAIHSNTGRTPEATAQPRTTLRLVTDEAVNSLSLTEAFAEFCEEKDLEGLAKDSIGQYRHAVEPFVRYMVETHGHDRLDAVTEADVRGFLKLAKEHGIGDRGLRARDASITCETTSGASSAGPSTTATPPPTQRRASPRSKSASPSSPS